MKFALDEPISFVNGDGEDDKTFELEFTGPTYRQIAHAAAMEQHIFHAFRNAENSRPPAAPVNPDDLAEDFEKKQAQKDDDDEDELDGITGDRVMVLLGMYSTDLAKVLSDFEKLALAVGHVNEDVSLTGKIFRQMSPVEISRLCGEYLAFFIMPSVRSKMKAMY